MATATPEEHHTEPVGRDADLPDLSDRTLACFAAVALVATAVALVMLLD
jgi:hypothetical protein